MHITNWQFRVKIKQVQYMTYTDQIITEILFSYKRFMTLMKHNPHIKRPHRYKYV